MKNTTKPAAHKLDGSECPICRGWNCTPESPHAAWILGTPANVLVRADAAARAAERVIADGVVFDLVRCIATGASRLGFGHRVYEAAITRGLIAWDDASNTYIAR